MTVTDLLERPVDLDRVEDDPVFLDLSGRRQKLLEQALVALLLAGLLFLGMACYALA